MDRALTLNLILLGALQIFSGVLVLCGSSLFFSEKKKAQIKKSADGKRYVQIEGACSIALGASWVVFGILQSHMAATPFWLLYAVCTLAAVAVFVVNRCVNL